jgi:hypothetical protein
MAQKLRDLIGAPSQGRGLPRRGPDEPLARRLHRVPTTERTRPGCAQSRATAGVVCPLYRGRPTSLSRLVEVSSSRSASVSSCPHSHSKKVRAERQTDSGPPSTTFSPHSWQIRTTCLEEPTTSTPSASLFLRGRHALTPARSAQGEPASTTRDLCFTQCCLNPRLRFRLARYLSSTPSDQIRSHAKDLPMHEGWCVWTSENATSFPALDEYGGRVGPRVIVAALLSARCRTTTSLTSRRPLDASETCDRRGFADTPPARSGGHRTPGPGGGPADT